MLFIVSHEQELWLHAMMSLEFNQHILWVFQSTHHIVTLGAFFYSMYLFLVSQLVIL